MAPGRDLRHRAVRGVLPLTGRRPDQALAFGHHLDGSLFPSDAIRPDCAETVPADANFMAVHHRQGAGARRAFQRLGPTPRRALLAFLDSL